MPYCFPQQLHHFTFPPTVHKGSNFSTFLPTLAISYCSCGFFFFFGFFLVCLFVLTVANLMDVRRYLILALILGIFWSFVYLLWRNVSQVLCLFFNQVFFFFLLLSYRSSLYILDVNPLSEIQFTFSPIL